MAIFHLSAQIISRKAGRSATAAAAYRSGSLVVDERTGEVHDYSRKRGVLHSEIVMPQGCAWQPNRSELWNAVELKNKRADAQVARDVVVALPHELPEDSKRALLRAFAQHIADRYSVGVDFALHEPDREGDERNYHGHILLTTNAIGLDGKLGNKVRALDGIAHAIAHSEDEKRGDHKANAIDRLRAEWADLVNAELERHGLTERIDHRSYAAQGVDLTPTKHIGVHAVGMDRRGSEAERIDLHNANRAEQARQITERPDIILDKITATQAVFTRRDMAAELNRYIDDREQFQVLLARLEMSPRLVEMEPATEREPAKFSTSEMIDTERGMVLSAARMAHSGQHGVSAARVEAVLDGFGTLSDEQKAAVRHVTQAGSLAAIVGDAGTGKSFSMRVAREAWEAQGFHVRGAAVAAKAKDELQAGSGIESRTLASLDYAWKEGRDRLTSRDVLVIDEAGMIGSRQLARVLDHAERAGAKVVLLGDDKQLAAIEAGAAFRGVVQHVGAAEITEVRRQNHAWAREAGQQIARGSVADGLAAYTERGHVPIHDTRQAAMSALAAAYVADRGQGSQLILAHSNTDVHALNQAVREARQERGELLDAEPFATERGHREFAAGDRLVFLKNNRDLGVTNGTLGTVERAEDGALAVRLDGGELCAFRADEYAAVDHGYAVTLHKSQGATVDRSYLLATPGMDRSLAYVGMTRHREAMTVYAGADDFTHRRAGRLVEHGAAPYEHDPENRLSYFATLENDQGERHTIWGVDLERALGVSGAKAGDRIALEHGGSETVRLPDGTTAERNTWHVRGAEDLARAALAKTFSRERPKASTLDYLPEFAELRGYDGESVLRRWIERGRERLGQLASRAREALQAAFERAGVDRQAPTMAEAGQAPGEAQTGRQGPQAQPEATPEAERAPAAPKRDRFAGLKLGRTPARDAARQAAPGDVSGRALDDFGQAWADLAKMRALGMPPMPHQVQALQRAEAALDGAQPGASQSLRVALARHAPLREATMAGGAGRSDALAAGLREEQALERQPAAYAAAIATSWAAFGAQVGRGGSDEQQARAYLAELARVIEAKPELRDALQTDARLLGIRRGSTLDRVAHSQSFDEAMQQARDNEQGRGR